MFGIGYFKNLLVFVSGMMALGRGGVFVFVFALLGLGWCLLGPSKPTVDANRRAIADAAIVKTLDAVHNQRAAIRQVAVLHFINDPTDHLTKSLRNRLNASGLLTVEDVPFIERLNNLLSLRNDGVYSLDEALDYGKKNRLDGVLIGKIDIFESYRNGARLIGQIDMVDVKAGRVVFSVALNEDLSSSLSARMKGALATSSDETGEMSFTPWYWRVFTFILIVLLLPIFTIVFIRTMVAKKSNGANAFVLAVYTAIDLVFAWMMVGGSFASSIQIWLFVAAGIGAFLYNVRIMTFALRLEDR